MDCSIATFSHDKIEAAKLVHKEYLDRGLLSAGESLPIQSNAIVFVAKESGTVIATMTLDFNVPMWTAFPDEVDSIMRLGRVAEVTRLAGMGLVFVGLGGLMMRTAERRGIDHLVAVVHPKSAKFYCKACAFECIGPVKEYPAVKNHPAIPMHLDLKLARLHKNYRRFNPDGV
jgi:hypothetical protein